MIYLYSYYQRIINETNINYYVNIINYFRYANTAKFSNKTINYRRIQRTEVKGGNVQLVDVRTPREYKSGHLDHAVNIDFYSGKFNTEFNKLDKQEAVYVYCRSGVRSRQTANKLAAMGFTEIYDLKGGILKYN